MTIVDRRLIAIARGVELLAQLAPRARATLRDRVSDADGFPPPSEVAVQTSRGTSSVESAGAARTAATSNLEDLSYQIDTLWTVTSDALRFVRKLVEPDAPVEDEPLTATTCKPRGREGADVWAADGLDCAELPDRLGLCPRHYMREYRWRRAVGLPPAGQQEQT